MKLNPNYQPPSHKQILRGLDDIAGQQRFIIMRSTGLPTTKASARTTRAYG
jgi:hypothetical protein